MDGFQCSKIVYFMLCFFVISNVVAFIFGFVVVDVLWRDPGADRAGTGRAPGQDRF